MMKFKLINNEVTDEREEALTNKVAAECFYIMIAGTLVCLVYGSLFNNGVITSNYLIFPILIAWVWSIYRAERLAVSAFGGSEYDSPRLFTGDWAYHPYDNDQLTISTYHNVYHNNPLDPRYLMAWPVTYIIVCSLCLFGELGYRCIGKI